MVGQLLLEDEYIINVKVRRPIDGPCPPPPTFTVACHDVNHSPNLGYHDQDNNGPFLYGPQHSKTLTRPGGRLALPESGYIGSFTVGPDGPCEEFALGSDRYSPKPIEWKTNCGKQYEGKDLIETSVTMQPGGRRLIADNCSQQLMIKDSSNVGQPCGLPQVKVYGDDACLLATNVFKAPNVEKPTQRGALYVERIDEHCKSIHGELYVPPVLQGKLKNKRDDDAPMPGNSRRSEAEKLIAKQKKNSFSSMITNSPGQQSTTTARDHLTDMLGNQVTSTVSHSTKCQSGVISLPLRRHPSPDRQASPPCRQLTFPTLAPCRPHKCPRDQQLDSSVQLSQSSTLFPHTPSGKIRQQSFNYPIPCSTKTVPPNDFDITNCEPCYSAVYSSPYANALSRNNSVSSCTESTDASFNSPETVPHVKPAFLQAPSSLRSRSSSLKDDSNAKQNTSTSQTDIFSNSSTIQNKFKHVHYRGSNKVKAPYSEHYTCDDGQNYDREYNSPDCEMHEHSSHDYAFHNTHHCSLAAGLTMHSPQKICHGQQCNMNCENSVFRPSDCNNHCTAGRNKPSNNYHRAPYCAGPNLNRQPIAKNKHLQNKHNDNQQSSSISNSKSLTHSRACKRETPQETQSINRDYHHKWNYGANRNRNRQSEIHVRNHQALYPSPSDTEYSGGPAGGHYFAPKCDTLYANRKQLVSRHSNAASASAPRRHHSHRPPPSPNWLTGMLLSVEQSVAGWFSMRRDSKKGFGVDRQIETS